MVLNKVIFITLLLICFACNSSEIRVDTEKSNAHYQLGIEFAQYKLMNNAIEEFNLAIKYNPESSKAHSKLGLIYFQLQNDDNPRFFPLRALCLFRAPQMPQE